jgi:mRNA-degrading endonuclease RelE of RelBE toxin-antitoxin system
VKSHITPDFRRDFDNLPPSIQQLARETYTLFKQNPNHPGINFKRIRSKHIAYSARIGMHYRALAYEDQGELYWFWIGSHEEYNQLVNRV